MWKIFYDDGSTYSDQDGTIETAPKLGVIIVASSDPDVGRKYDRSCDYYVWHSYGWRGVDQFGLYDYLSQSGSKVVLFGRTVEDRRWKEIWQQAIDDDYLPRKSAWHSDEAALRDG